MEITNCPNFYTSEPFICVKDALEKYKCASCGFEADLMVEINEHVRTTHKSKNATPAKSIEEFYCQNCNFKTYSRLILTKHALDLCLKQKRCFIKVKSDKDLKSHELLKYTVVCEECPFRTTCRKYLKRHILVKHTAPQDVKWFQCNQCAFKSKWKGNLKGHILTIHMFQQEATKLKCQQCDFETKWKSSMRKHMLSRHTAYIDIKWVQCGKCPYKTIRNDLLKRHIITNHTAVEDIKWYVCNLCHQKMKRRDGLKRHLQEQHYQLVSSNDSLLKDLLLGKHIELSGLEMSKMSSLWKFESSQMSKMSPETRMFHNNSKENENSLLKQLLLEKHPTPKIFRFQCDQCSYTSIWERGIKLHKLISHGVQSANVNQLKFATRKYKCDHCPYQTEWKGSLKIHKLMKHGSDLQHLIPKTEGFIPLVTLAETEKAPISPEKPQCVKKEVDDEIETEAIQNVPAIKEEVVPAKNDYFECDQCSYKTCRYHLLRRHSLTRHTISKPKQTENAKINWYQCKFCSLHIKRSDNLRRHVRERHPEIDHTKHLYNLVLSTSNKNPNAWYECDQCVFKTEWQGSLKIHKLMKHSAQ